MGDDTTPKYTFFTTTTELSTYQDGFADGYSRAWQECWEYMRQLSNPSEEKKEEAK